MKIKYKEPKPLMEDLLNHNFQNNQYFKFEDFVQKVNSSGSNFLIDYDMMKDFIYEMIDENKIVQEYAGEGVNPMTPEEDKVKATNKSIRFKLITQQK
jgi:hypothetical protein